MVLKSLDHGPSQEKKKAQNPTVLRRPQSTWLCGLPLGKLSLTCSLWGAMAMDSLNYPLGSACITIMASI